MLVTGGVSMVGASTNGLVPRGRNMLRYLPPPAQTRRRTGRAILTAIVLASTAAGQIHVDASAGANGNGISWGTAYNNLDTALAVAGGLGVGSRLIYVAVGTYIPSANNGRTDSFTVPNGTRIYGGFDGELDPDDRSEDNFSSCILSGDVGTSGVFTDNSYHVVTVESGSAETRIDGFRIEKGNANGTNEDRFGGGVYCVDTDLTLYNLYVEQNYALVGGGVYYRGDEDGDGFRLYRGWFSNNASRNTGGGIHLANLGIPTESRLEDEDLDEPSWIYNSTFSRCLAGTNGSQTPAEDGGAAIYIANRQEFGVFPTENEDSTMVVYNSQFFDNYVYGGGAAVRIEAATANGHRTIWCNCTMAYNVVLDDANGDDAGTIWMDAEATNKESIMANSICMFTLAGGGGSAAGSAIEGPGSAAALGAPQTAGTFWVADSCVEVVTSMVNNGVYSNGGAAGCINEDPEFVDPVNFDLHLDSGAQSPCIDLGDNACHLADLPDMDNDSDYDEPSPFHIYVSEGRLVNSIIDMGCFEDQ
jgi:hypothetical protein